MPWWMYLVLIGFMASIFYTVVAVGMASGSSDARASMASAITNVTIINSVLMLVLAGTAYFYVATEPMAERPYIMIMLHVSLLLSIISVSITSLHQLNSA